MVERAVEMMHEGSDPDRQIDALLADLHRAVDDESFLRTCDRAQTNEKSTPHRDADPDDADWSLIEHEPVQDDDYVVVDTTDVIEAMAEFIAIAMAKLPAMQSSTTRTMQSMLSATLGEIRSGVGAVGKVWAFGSFLYTTYGWTAYAINMYQQPAMVYLITQAVWSATKWACGAAAAAAAAAGPARP